MKRYLRAALFMLLLGAPLSNALAQQVISPAADPVTGAVPDGPSGAQETHDAVSIQQLMKIVELSRLIGGGITQLFAVAQGQHDLLDLIRGAQIGPKNFPVLNGPAEVAERKGGEGLREMADGALDGAAQGPADLIDALNRFRTTFNLDEAFKLKDDELTSQKMLAQLAAKGAIAGSAAENAYKRSNSSMDRLNGYIGALQASPDIKTSIDINTRAVIELTQQTNESIRTQAALTSVVSAYFMALASEASETDWVDGLKDFNR